VQLAVGDFGGIKLIFNSAGVAVRRAKFLDIADDLFKCTFGLA